MAEVVRTGCGGSNTVSNDYVMLHHVAERGIHCISDGRPSWPHVETKNAVSRQHEYQDTPAYVPTM